jgi:hypothetical protein
MSYSNISAAIVAADKTAVQTAIQTIKSKMPFLINLSIDERKKLRKMASVRTSYVQDVYQASVGNSGAIPQGINLVEYGKDLQLYRDLSDIMSWFAPLYESIESTSMALGSELMKQSDECYGHLKVAAKKSTNQSLNTTVSKIASQLKQSPKPLITEKSLN